MFEESMVRKLIMIGVCFLGIMIIGYSAMNLHNYGVYYAFNIPHSKNRVPILTEVFNSTELLKEPNYKKTGIRYKIDWSWRREPSYIFNDDLKLEAYQGSMVPKDSNRGYSVDFDTGNNSIRGIFDSDGKLFLCTVSSDYNQKIDLSFDLEKSILDKTNRTMNEIGHIQTRPQINLQWIYNLFNYWRFN